MSGCGYDIKDLLDAMHQQDVAVRADFQPKLVAQMALDGWFLFSDTMTKEELAKMICEVLVEIDNDHEEEA